MPTPPPTELNDPLLGASVGGRFRIIDRLGAGGFGVVYRAEQLSIDRPVAIKVLGLRASGPDARKRFRREAQVLSRLTSPHTVRLIDFGVLDDGRFYYVMEYLEGQALEDLIACGPVPVDVALRIAEQICHALQEAHGQQVVHRDLKPANVWLQQVSGDRVVKLLDFGTARLLDGDKVTRSEVLIGTPAYLAPEQCRSGTLDGRADLYALGLLMFEMIAGRHPFGEGVLAEMVYRHVHAPPPSLIEAAQGVPPRLSDLVRRLMAKDPADRPASAWAVRLELERLLAGHGSGRVLGLAPTALYGVIAAPASSDGPARTAERSTRALDAAEVRGMADGPRPVVLDETVPSLGPDFRAAVAAGVAAPDALARQPEAAEPEPTPKKARGWLVVPLLIVLGLGLGAVISATRGDLAAPEAADSQVVRLTIAPRDAAPFGPASLDAGRDMASDAGPDAASRRRGRPAPAEPTPRATPRVEPAPPNTRASRAPPAPPAKGPTRPVNVFDLQIKGAKRQ